MTLNDGTFIRWLLRGFGGFANILEAYVTDSAIASEETIAEFKALQARMADLIAKLRTP